MQLLGVGPFTGSVDLKTPLPRIFYPAHRVPRLLPIHSDFGIPGFLPLKPKFEISEPSEWNPLGQFAIILSFFLLVEVCQEVDQRILGVSCFPKVRNAFYFYFS